jgi:hypothetical protein
MIKVDDTLWTENCRATVPYIAENNKKIIGVVKQYFNIILMAFRLQIGANDNSNIFLTHDDLCVSTELFLLLVHPLIWSKV